MHAHINRFDEIAGKVLRDLYGKFPQGSRPNPKSIGLTDEEPVLEKGRQLVSAEWEIIRDEINLALQWLTLEQLIAQSPAGQSSTFILTSKGFKALQRWSSECVPPRIS
ncbi:hypothetical protein [Pseudomonas petrae]|uniref:hypothetical protein n=1 Tax=Pseudomonas petrae TaxID=2912190 RepID=UPI001F1E0067|nr:hypothetical protein [Pseudomonas petrae]MCF7558893.1 hypothetical protein [Pseudomonas petrae]